MTSVTDSVLARVFATLTVDSVGSLMIKVALTVNNNDSPVIEAVGVELD
jgi:hypothetical protein